MTVQEVHTTPPGTYSYVIYRIETLRPRHQRRARGWCYTPFPGSIGRDLSVIARTVAAVRRETLRTAENAYDYRVTAQRVHVIQDDPTVVPGV